MSDKKDHKVSRQAPTQRIYFSAPLDWKSMSDDEKDRWARELAGPLFEHPPPPGGGHEETSA